MTMRASWRYYFGLAAMLTGVAGWLLYRSAQRRSDAQAIEAERGRLISTQRSLETQLAAAGRERAKSQAELEALAKTLPGPPRPAGAPPRRVPDAAQLAARAKQARARLTLKYAPFYRAAGLDSATAARFEQAVFEYEAQENDVSEIALKLPPENRTERVPEPYEPGTESVLMDPAIAAMRRRLAAQFEADQIALLGEAGYRRLQEYRREEGKRRVVEQLVGDLAVSEAPLTPAQTSQLAGLLAGIDFGGKRVPDEKPWPEILARAGGVLSAPQLAMLKKQADKAEHAAAHRELSRLLRERDK